MGAAVLYVHVFVFLCVMCVHVCVCVTIPAPHSKLRVVMQVEVGVAWELQRGELEVEGAWCTHPACCAQSISILWHVFIVYTQSTCTSLTTVFMPTNPDRTRVHSSPRTLE